MRFAAVDALRGFDMFWIMGGDYIIRSLPGIHDSSFTRTLAAQMEHCEWAGFHFYDLIFPLFVFIVGISIAFSVPRMLEERGRAATIKRITIRAVVLFLLGIFYMGGLGNGFSNVYFAGVLHRIAVAYFFAALLFCLVRVRGLALLAAALLVGYWLLMTCVPVPGIGTPDLSMPGRNLAHYLDSLYLPGKKFEGTLLSTMGAVANCLLGSFAGLFLKNRTITQQRKVLALAAAGLLSLAAGFSWGQAFPIIKLLWTSSYVLVACGYGAILLAIFIQLIDVWQWRKWAQPFVWIGMNALTIYIIGNIVNFHRLALRFVGGDVGRALGSYAGFVQAVLGMLLGLSVVWFLYRRRIFLRL